jgi:hypothetical protein
MLNHLDLVFYTSIASAQVLITSHLSGEAIGDRHIFMSKIQKRLHIFKRYSSFSSYSTFKKDYFLEIQGLNVI